MKKLPDDIPTKKVLFQIAIIIISVISICAIGIIYAKCGKSSELSGPSKPIDPSLGKIEYLPTCKECYAKKMKSTFVKPQPTCPYRKKKSQFKALLPRLYCTLEDVNNPEAHKMPIIYPKKRAKNNSNHETQNVVVNYIIAALLLISMGAALLELYRAKTSGNKKNEGQGAKAPLNKKCSLADLTVLKHHRRELVRRESILEPHCEDEGNYQQHQGFQPSPLQRRCSFPASLSSSDDTILGRVGCSRRNSRKLSDKMAGDIRRRMSAVNEVRKLSILPDDGFWRRGSLVGEDSSPERRVHHSRLVHRH